MPGGRASRQKGNRGERSVVNQLLNAGLPASRCPLSGAATGRFDGFDIAMSMLGRDVKIECKNHGDGFRRIYQWLAPVDLLMMRADRSEQLVTMRLDLFVELVLAAEGKKPLICDKETGG